MIKIELIKDPTADSDDLEYELGDQFEFQLKSTDPKGWYFDVSIKFKEYPMHSGNTYKKRTIKI